MHGTCWGNEQTPKRSRLLAVIADEIRLREGVQHLPLTVFNRPRLPFHFLIRNLGLGAELAGVFFPESTSLCPPDFSLNTAAEEVRYFNPLVNPPPRPL